MVHKYQVEMEGSFQTLYMKDMQKDIPNILHACTCCGVSAPMQRYRGGVMTPRTPNSSLTTPSMSSQHSPSLSCSPITENIPVQTTRLARSRSPMMDKRIKNEKHTQNVKTAHKNMRSRGTAQAAVKSW